MSSKHLTKGIHTDTLMRAGDANRYVISHKGVEMEIEFNWASQSDPDDQSQVEEELKAAFEDAAIQECHPATVLITSDPDL